MGASDDVIPTGSISAQKWIRCIPLGEHFVSERLHERLHKLFYHYIVLMHYGQRMVTWYSRSSSMTSLGEIQMMMLPTSI